jgi:hypothetical protein
MSSVTNIMSLASTLSLNDMLVLNAELAQQLLLRQAAEAARLAAEAEAARLAAEAKAEAEAKAKAKAKAAAGQGRKQYVITARGEAKGMKASAYSRPLKAHQAIHVLTVLRNAGHGMSKKDIVEALDEEAFMEGCNNKGGPNYVVGWWLKDFIGKEWIEQAE